jgi:hypothetical protein
MKMRNFNFITEQSSNESGGVIIFLAFFLMGMISLLILSIDGHFLIQSRLEEQNISEYFSIAALTGFETAKHTGEEDDEFTARRNAALQFLQSIQNNNSVMGLYSTGWDFSSASCDELSCFGNDWYLSFGQWNEIDDNGQFLGCDTEDPDVTDCINSVYLSLKFNKGEIIRFFHKAPEDQEKVETSTIAYITHQGKRRIRIAKVAAKGKAG